MRSPTDYLLDAWQPDPEEWPAGGIARVPQAQAERAIAAAQADTHRYHSLLARAIRNAKNEPAQPLRD